MSDEQHLDVLPPVADTDRLKRLTRYIHGHSRWATLALGDAVWLLDLATERLEERTAISAAAAFVTALDASVAQLNTPANVRRWRGLREAVHPVLEVLDLLGEDDR